MNVELRLRSLEAKQAVRNGVFLVFENEDGTAEYTTPKGKKKSFASVEDAKSALREKYGDPVIITIDLWGLT